MALQWAGLWRAPIHFSEYRSCGAARRLRPRIRAMCGPLLGYRFAGHVGMANCYRSIVRAGCVPLVSALADTVPVLPVDSAARGLDRELSRYLLFAPRVDCRRN